MEPARMDPRANFVRVAPPNGLTILLAGLLLTTGVPSQAQTTGQASTAAPDACVGDSGGITLPPGFCATVFADKLGHARHMAVAPNGVVYVNTYFDLGSATNSCQSQNRMPNVPGNDPCTELETRAGIWRYDANRLDQHFSPAERFATGLRNGEGISFDSAGRIFATQHGRDQLGQNWPKLYTLKQNANLPAEELVILQHGRDFGWPECYYDDDQKKLVLAPEYGGDGGKAVGVCSQKEAPVAAFPAHWAPNDMLIYEGSQFPSAYKDGAFIAFHGSWNRAPEPQGGYNVVFQPLADGKASGPFVVFADGFAGAMKQPGQAAHRPTGLALGPDGAIYIADDQGGRIWRVTFQGGKNASGIAAAAPAPSTG